LVVAVPARDDVLELAGRIAERRRVEGGVVRQGGDLDQRLGDARDVRVVEPRTRVTFVRSKPLAFFTIRDMRAVSPASANGS